jgi:hypothetical protein
MTSTTHGQFKAVGASEVHCVGNVGAAEAAGDQRRALVDHPVMYPAYIVVPRFIRTQKHARKPSGQVGDICLIE